MRGAGLKISSIQVFAHCTLLVEFCQVAPEMFQISKNSLESTPTPLLS